MFNTILQHILPELLGKRARERRITIWSAGCSSGQEPYSLAMMLGNALSMHPGWTTQIIATDLSEEMLAKAKRARYGQLENIPAAAEDWDVPVRGAAKLAAVRIRRLPGG